MGYEWATTSLGVSLTVMFRETAVRFALDEHIHLVRSFYEVFSSTSFRGDSAGWLLGVWPKVVLHESADGGSDVHAFAVELRAAAFASNRNRCADRLSRMFAWMTELMEQAARRPGSHSSGTPNETTA